MVTVSCSTLLELLIFLVMPSYRLCLSHYEGHSFIFYVPVGDVDNTNLFKASFQVSNSGSETAEVVCRVGFLFQRPPNQFMSHYASAADMYLKQDYSATVPTGKIHDFTVEGNISLGSPEGSVMPTAQVTSTKPVSLVVSSLIWTGFSIGAESFLALPIEALGVKYIVTMIAMEPYIAVTATRDSKVHLIMRVTDIEVKEHPNKDHVFTPNEWPVDGEIKSGKDFAVRMKRNETRWFSSTSRTGLSFAGTVIKARYPIGVVCGNIAANLVGDRQSAMMEMVPPVGSAGKTFLISSSPGYNRGRGEYILVTAAQDETTDVHSVEDYDKDKKILLVSLKSEGDTWMYEFGVAVINMTCCKMTPNQLMRLYATKDILVVQIRKTSFANRTNVNNFDSSGGMLFVPPIRLFMNRYTLRPPRLGKGTYYQQNFVIVLAEKEVPFMTVPDKLFSAGTELMENKSLKAFVLEHILGTREIGLLLSIESADCAIKFHAYMSGASLGHGYLHPAGMFVDVDIANKRSCEVTVGVPDDEMDNDCDGRVDEEKSSETDLDGDGMVGEDMCTENKANGSWGHWSHWSTCEMKTCRLSRKRNCDNPPAGPGGIPCSTKNGTSQTEYDFMRMPECLGKICPFECPVRTYSTVCKPCIKTCEYCDAFSGDCIRCDPGYKRSSKQCLGCPAGQFGFNCSFSCSGHCAEFFYSCEKTTGKCTIKGDVMANTIVFLMVLIILIALISWCLTRRSEPADKNNTFEKNLEAEKMPKSPEAKKSESTALMYKA